jgi:hypothetical protein
MHATILSPPLGRKMPCYSPWMHLNQAELESSRLWTSNRVIRLNRNRSSSRIPNKDGIAWPRTRTCLLSLVVGTFSILVCTTSSSDFDHLHRISDSALEMSWSNARSHSVTPLILPPSRPGSIVPGLPTPRGQPPRRSSLTSPQPTVEPTPLRGMLSVHTVLLKKPQRVCLIKCIIQSSTTD